MSTPPAAGKNPSSKPGLLARIAEALLATVFCFLVIFLFNLFIGHPFHKIEKFNPLVNQIEDFEVSDYLFAYTHKSVIPDSNIIIIDCASDSRDEMAEKIGQIERAGARGIGIDLLFEYDMDSAKNRKLIDTLNRYKSNIIFAAGYNEANEQATFDYPFYKEMLNRNNGESTYHIGYLKPEDRLQTKRTFTPLLGPESNDTVFAVKIASLAFGKEAIQALSNRQEKEVIINYRNGIAGMPRYWMTETVPAPEELNGRVVLLGNCDSNDFADRHYSPLNKFIGKSYPDISGAEYHAQIISMIASGDYIDSLKWQKLWIFAACFVLMFLFVGLFHFHNYYHFILDILLIVILIVSLVVSHFLLESYSIKLEPKEFIGYIFVCGLLLHLYYPFRNFLIKFIARKKTKQ